MKEKIQIFGAIFLLICIFFIEQMYIFRISPYPCEDAYITFRFSKNLADGKGPVFNCGERVEGYSNPLWMVSLAVARAFGLDIVASSQKAGICFNCLTLLLMLIIPWRFFNVRGVLLFFAPMLYLFCLPFHFYAVSGLETSFYTFLVTISAAAIIWAKDSGSRFIVASFLLLLVALTRPEGIIFFVSYCLWLCWRFVKYKESLRSYIPGILLFGILYGTFILLRIFYYGLPLPNTYYAKGTFPFYVRFMLGFFINKDFFIHYPWLLFFASCLFFLKMSTNHQVVLPLYLFIVSGIFFSLCFGGWDWMPFYRYNLPVLPLMIICCSLIFAQLWQGFLHIKKSRLILSLIVVCLLFVVIEQYWKDLAVIYRWGSLTKFARYNQEAIGKWIYHNLEGKPSIAIGDIGYFAYLSNANILDLYGLTNREFAQLKASHAFPTISFSPFSINFDAYKKGELELLLKLEPDYVFLYSATLKISDTYPGSARGIVENEAFKEKYQYMTSFSVIPDVTTNAWPRFIHPIDVADLSTGILSWIQDNWGYVVYVRKNSSYPRFHIHLSPDAKINYVSTQ